MAGICACVVTSVNVILYAGACLNAPTTSPVVLRILATLLFIIENSSIGLTTAPSLNRVTSAFMSSTFGLWADIFRLSGFLASFSAIPPALRLYGRARSPRYLRIPSDAAGGAVRLKVGSLLVLVRGR